MKRYMDHAVTGRDAYILGEALAHAIAAIDSLPPDRRPESNRDDMVALFHAIAPDERTRELHAETVERRTGHAPDLTDWKRSGD
jgi:hypothetical protein